MSQRSSSKSRSRSRVMTIAQAQSKTRIDEEQLIELQYRENRRHSAELSQTLKKSYAEMKARVAHKLAHDSRSRVTLSTSRTIGGCAAFPPSILDLQALPPGTVLNVKQQTRIDKLRKELIKPVRHVPPTHLPDWPHVPLDVKLPLVEAGRSLKYSRGKLCQPLPQKLKTPLYTVYDPRNWERTIQDYSALHDPKTKNYLKKPHVVKLLKRQGLIGDEGDVMCNVTQFNQYRLYLKHHHHELERKLIYLDDLGRLNRDQNNTLQQSLIKTDGRAVRYRRRVKANQEENYKEKITQFRENEREEEHRLEKVQDRLFNERMEKMARNEMMDTRRAETYARAQKAEQDRRIRIFAKTLEKEFSFTARARRREIIVREITRQYELQRLTDTCAFQEQHRAEMLAIEEAVEVEHKIKAKQNLTHNLILRASMPGLIFQRKAEALRIHELTYKYFHLWLSVVKRRRQLRPDDEHISLWEIGTVVAHSVNYIRHKAGIEKFNNVVMNMLKQKFAAKKEMTEEEKEAAIAEKLAKMLAASLSSVEVEPVLQTALQDRTVSI